MEVITAIFIAGNSGSHRSSCYGHISRDMDLENMTESQNVKFKGKYLPSANEVAER